MEVQTSFDTLAAARVELERHELIREVSSEPAAYELTASGRITLERLTATGAQRLSDLLDGWNPEEHEDLARLIATLAREFLSTPRHCGEPRLRRYTRTETSRARVDAHRIIPYRFSSVVRPGGNV